MVQLNTEQLTEPREQVRAYSDLLDQITAQRKASKSRGGRIELDAMASIVERGLVRALARVVLEPDR